MINIWIEYGQEVRRYNQEEKGYKLILQPLTRNRVLKKYLSLFLTILKLQRCFWKIINLLEGLYHSQTIKKTIILREMNSLREVQFKI